MEYKIKRLLLFQGFKWFLEWLISWMLQNKIRMSYPGQPNYGALPPYEGNPGYCPPPPTTVVYQTVGNCPNCRVSSSFKM